MNLYNCFVVFGSERAPEVHLLSQPARALLDSRMSLQNLTERMRMEAYAATFGRGAEVALPAWSQECMVAIAEKYEGPHQTALRGLCAAIALGKTYGPDDDIGNGTDPSDKVPRSPIKPKRGGPAKIARVAQSAS